LLQHKNSKFTQLLKEFDVTHKKPRALELMLTMPRHRLLRYVVLLKDLMNYSAGINQTERILSLSAVQKIEGKLKDFAAKPQPQTPEQQDDSSNLDPDELFKVAFVDRILQGTFPCLLEWTKRRLIKEGSLTVKTEEETKTGPKDERKFIMYKRTKQNGPVPYFFLFIDLLFCCEINSQTEGTPMFQLRKIMI